MLDFDSLKTVNEIAKEPSTGNKLKLSFFDTFVVIKSKKKGGEQRNEVIELC